MRIAQEISKLQSLLDRAENAVIGLGNRRGWRPAPASNEHLDQRDARFIPVGRVDPVRWGFTRVAVLQILAAGSQAQALARLIQDPPTVYAIPTVSRASLEASARAGWLVDPGVNRDARAVRRALEMLDEIKWLERREYERASEDRESLATWAIQAGFPVKRGGDGRLSMIADKGPPKISELVRSFGGGGEGLIRLWEEAAQTSHSRITGLMRYATLGPSEDDPAMGSWSDQLDWCQVWIYVAVPVLALLTAADRMASVAGWTSSSWRHHKDELLDTAAGLVQRAADSRGKT